MKKYRLFFTHLVCWRVTDSWDLPFPRHVHVYHEIKISKKLNSEKISSIIQPSSSRSLRRKARITLPWQNFIFKKWPPTFGKFAVSVEKVKETFSGDHNQKEFYLSQIFNLCPPPPLSIIPISGRFCSSFRKVVQFTQLFQEWTFYEKCKSRSTPIKWKMSKFGRNSLVDVRYVIIYMYFLLVYDSNLARQAHKQKVSLKFLKILVIL